jgi:CRISPR/Cas system-associated endoribonuclease Cas2
LEIFRIAAGYARSQQFFYDKLLEKISGDNLKDNLKKTRDFAFLEYEKLNVFFRDKFSSLWTQYSTFMQDLEEMYRDERNLQLTEDLTQIIKKNSIDESLALRFVSDRESMGAEFYRKVANLFQDPTEALFFNTLYNDKKANLDDIQQNQWDKVKV